MGEGVNTVCVCVYVHGVLFWIKGVFSRHAQCSRNRRWMDG